MPIATPPAAAARMMSASGDWNCQKKKETVTACPFWRAPTATSTATTVSTTRTNMENTFQAHVSRPRRKRCMTTAVVSAVLGRSMFRSTFYDPLHRAGTAIGPSSNTLHDREEGARTLVDAFGGYSNPAISAYLKRVPVAGAVDVDGPHRKTPAADVSGR
jgi:hypothetical protein